MRPVARALLATAVAALALIAGFAGGWFARGSALGSENPPATLSVIAAGSLAPRALLPALIAEFANQTPGVAAPIAAQLYEGSSAAATALRSAPQPYDIFVSADFRVIPQDLEPPTSTVAAWEVVFASDPLVLAYNTATLAGITSSDWFENITAPGITLGTPNASVDPLGADGIIAIELEDAVASLGGSLYGHFYTGTEGDLAGPTSHVKIVAEENAATAITTGEVDAYLVYRSYAVAEGLSYVTLSPEVDLGGTSSSDVSGYSARTTTVLFGGGTKVVSGAPILFALTVPTTAPDVPLGVVFAAFLLSNATLPAWTADGFDPLGPSWVDHPADVPAALSGDPPAGFPSLPPYLAALVG